MPTLPYVADDEADQRTEAAWQEIRSGFGNGVVPNVYRVLGHNATVLEAAVEHRRRIMDEGNLDPMLKEFLAWASVTLANNQFGIETHTARLKRLGVSDADIVEALGVLQYFTGISVVINGLAMAHDSNDGIKKLLYGDPVPDQSGVGDD